MSKLAILENRAVDENLNEGPGTGAINKLKWHNTSAPLSSFEPAKIAISPILCLL